MTYIIKFLAGVTKLMVMDGVLEGASHFVPLLVLLQLLLFILQCIEPLIDVLQELLDFLTPALCKGQVQSLNETLL